MGMIKVGQRVEISSKGTVVAVDSRIITVADEYNREVYINDDWDIKVLSAPEPPEGTVVFAKALDSHHGHFMRLFNDTSTERWAGVDGDNYGCYYAWEDLTSDGYNA